MIYGSYVVMFEVPLVMHNGKLRRVRCLLITKDNIEPRLYARAYALKSPISHATPQQVWFGCPHQHHPPLVAESRAMALTP